MILSKLPPRPGNEDTASVEEIFRRHVPRLYVLALQMTGNEADAEDVIQDVLVKVLRKLDTFRGEAELSTWLYRITVNAVLSLRQKLALRERQLDAPLADLGDKLDLRRDAPKRPEQQVLEGESQEVVAAAVAALPEKYRDVYLLAEVERLAYADIAELLGLSLAAVKSRLHRARLFLREDLAAYFS